MHEPIAPATGLEPTEYRLISDDGICHVVTPDFGKLIDWLHEHNETELSVHTGTKRFTFRISPNRSY